MNAYIAKMGQPRIPNFKLVTRKIESPDITPPKIYPGQTLKARSAGDSDCIFTIKIISRTAKTATFIKHNETRTSKVHTDDRGEYLRPDRWSFAPIFRPEEVRP